MAAIKSTEEKAKAYDEAIKRAKDFMNGEAHYELKIGENIMCWVFPELRESEDERMRAMAIKAVHSPEAQSCIKSWGINPDDVIAWLEKQSEQKPADKIEPKFKVGNWVVIDSEALYIKEVTEDGYLTDEGGLIPFRCDKEAHLWTIQDAKDGDVLSFNDGHGNDCIELIKSITDKKIEFWFCLTNGNRYEVFDGITPYTNLASREDATPATKEQREQLEKAMADAGYTFDFEKKELKKIEQKPIKVPKFKVGDFIQFNGMGHTRYTVKEVCGLSHYINTCNKRMDMSYTDANFELVEQKPAEWSEEDEEIHRKCICVMRTSACGFPEEEDFVEQVNDWLKSLKDRVQAQSQWRPSEEMLEALYRAIPENTMAISEDEMLLDKLYQGLKYGRVLSNK